LEPVIEIVRRHLDRAGTTAAQKDEQYAIVKGDHQDRGSMSKPANIENGEAGATSLSLRPRDPNKGNLLFMSPAVPDQSGNGLRMRIAMFLDALTDSFNVDLLVVPIVEPSVAVERLPSVVSKCANATMLSLVGKEDPTYRMIAEMSDPKYRFAALAGYAKPVLLRYATENVVAEVSGLYSDVDYQAVHVTRLYMAPFAERYLERTDGRPPVCQLDLDDIESQLHEALACVSAENGDDAMAYFEHSEASKYGLLEDTSIPQFHRVFVCSAQDQTEIMGRYPSTDVTVVPNAVRIPPSLPPPADDGPFTFLFVGTMDYFPNEDAMVFFCGEVLPKMRREATRDFQLLIVGPFPTEIVISLARNNREVTVTGQVPDVRPYYQDAHAVLVPIRVGGGMRIKVLEAFSCRRPVIATSFAVEGTFARNGDHYLEAEDAEEFAKICLRLMNHDLDASKIVEKAFELVRSRFGYERVRELIKHHST
jgi:glycosyltransferase involved in cell wall biosynthesis